jgi:predicted RNase H-like HicB family nuclease
MITWQTYLFLTSYAKKEVLVVLTEYVEEALKRARYEIIDDEEPYYGEVPELKGVWATGKTLEKCRNNLKEVIEGWILLSIKRELPIPRTLTNR